MENEELAPQGIEHADEQILADWNSLRTDEPEEVAEKPAVTRQPDGKFAPKETVETTVETPAIEQEQTQTLESPKSLKKEIADKYWAQVPPELQSALVEREQAFNNGIERYKERAAVADRFESVISPFAQNFEKAGVAPDVAIRELLGTEHILRNGSPQEKTALLVRLAHSYGVPIEALSQSGQSDQQMLELRQRLNAMESQQTQSSQEQARREQAALHSEIAQFAEGKADFEALKPAIRALLAGNVAMNLPEAYEKARWADPTTRAALMAQQQEAAQKEAQRKAIEAKKAAGTNISSRGTVAAAGPTRTMEENILESAKALGLA